MTPEEKFIANLNRKINIVICICIPVLIICSVMLYFKLKEPSTPVKQIQSKIDSVKQEKVSISVQAQEQSFETVKKAQKITDKIKTYEKPIIRDTNDAAMREYITNYRYDTIKR